jgi:FMN-dependent NADH-azoreductase
MQKKYVDLILGFMGFTDIRSIEVEPTLAGGPETAAAGKQAAIDRARKLAAEF